MGNLATFGPIVVLMPSDYGSNAILIRSNRVATLSLPDLDYMEVDFKASELTRILQNDSLKNRNSGNIALTRILEWLWDVAVEPVLKELGFTELPRDNDSWPHIWWIPTDSLALFPIHAAGHHSIKGKNTMDRVISSYAPTARVLDHARRQMSQLKGTSQNVMLVSMSTTPGRKALPFARIEVARIEKLLPPSIKRFKSERPMKSEVLEKIRQYSIAHFTCHGETDPEPSMSRILLSDWQTDCISIGDIAQEKLDHVELAYISACHSANHGDRDLVEEAVHLAASFLLAGFPCVIGTLWQVDDRYSADEAEYVYRSMLREDATLVLLVQLISPYITTQGWRLGTTAKK